MEMMTMSTDKVKALTMTAVARHAMKIEAVARYMPAFIHWYVCKPQRIGCFGISVSQ